MGVKSILKRRRFRGIASSLLEAERARSPLSINDVPFLSEEDGYRIQMLVREHAAERGDEPAGYKISMTSSEIQASLGTDQPGIGFLRKSRILQSPARVRASDLSEPMIESELVFVVMEELPARPSEQDLLEGTRVAAGIEIPDSRFAQWFGRLPVGALLADSAVAGLVVWSPTISEWTFASVAQTRVELRLEDGVIAEGQADYVMGNPAHALTWLAQKLSERGSRLMKGDVVSSGTFHLPMTLRPGRYTARFDGFGEAEVLVT